MKPSEDRIYVTNVRDRFSSYPSKGLTPQKLGTILKEADYGNVYRQYELFEEMEEKDARLFSVLQTRKLAVANKKWEIIAASDSAQDKRIADFVKENFENLDMENIFIDLMDAVGKGYSVCEIMWDISPDAFRISSIDWCHQKRFIPNWSEDNSRRLQGFRLTSDEHPQGIELPDRKFIIHRYKAKSGNPERGGLIRILAWMYLFKNYDIKDWVAFAEVFGMPLRLGKYESGATSEEKQVLIDAVANLGSDAAAIIPSNTIIEIIEAIKGSSVNVYETLANFCNKEMSIAVLGQSLTTDIGDTGSFAAEQGHELVRQDLLEADGKSLERAMKLQAIKYEVDLNFGEQKAYPSLKLHVEKPEDMKAEAEKDKILVYMGVKIPAKFMHEKYGIPQAKEGEEVIEPPEKGGGMQFKQPVVKPLVVDLKSRYSKLDVEIRNRTDEAVPQYEKRIKSLKKLVAKSRGFKDLRNSLDKVLSDWDFIESNGKVLKDGLRKSAMIARDKVKSQYKLKNPHYALQVEIDWDLQFEEALNFFRLQAFTVSHVEDAQILAAMKQGILKAMEEGTTFAQYKKEIDQVFENKGLPPLSRRHLETVFNSNMQSAYMAGKFHQLNRLGEFFPYWQYITMDDGKVRPSHEAMHMAVYHKDDPIWREWYPPNGFGCRCDVEAADDDDLAKGGYNLLDSKTSLPIDIGTGKVYHPDEGWQSNIALSTSQFEKWLEQKETSGISLNKKPEDYGWKGDLAGAKDPGHFSGDFKGFLNGLLDKQNKMITYDGKIYVPQELIDKKLIPEVSKHPYALRFKDAIMNPQEVWGIIEGNKYKIRILKRYEDNRGLVIILKYDRNVLEDMELLTYTGTSKMKYMEDQRNGILIYKD